MTNQSKKIKLLFNCIALNIINYYLSGNVLTFLPWNLLPVDCIVDGVTLLHLGQNVKIFSLNHREETYVDSLTVLNSVADLHVNCLTLLVLHRSALKYNFYQ